MGVKLAASENENQDLDIRRKDSQEDRELTGR
jgi:hypothetical protein